ncbi:MAG TPA: hypothetical protein PLZ84_04985 [Clostridia bacterium]|nr:hypothetical protein [Clostridia bacterium]
MSKITILCGNYGSGKSEIALNTALKLPPGTTLIDLDIINPYFRSGDQAELLKKHGIKVISPVFTDKPLDIPALSPAVSAVISAPGDIVIDVGGTENGAVALGRYNAEITANSYTMALVINALRPFSSDANEIVKLADLIKHRSRLNFTCIYNNTNLALETLPEYVIEGDKVCREVSRLLGIPVSKTWALPEIIEKLPPGIRETAQPIKLYMRPSWLY